MERERAWAARGPAWHAPARGGRAFGKCAEFGCVWGVGEVGATSVECGRVLPRGSDVMMNAERTSARERVSIEESARGGEEERVRVLAERELVREGPEGGGPDRRSVIRSGWVLMVVGALLVGAVVLTFALLGPGLGSLVSLSVLLLYVLATAPVWGTGLLRRKERLEARERVREELERGRGSREARSGRGV